MSIPLEDNFEDIIGKAQRGLSLNSEMLAAKAGIYGNSTEEATYPFTRTDATGAALDGAKGRYTLTFAGNQFPPVNAFWSVTMYHGGNQLLVQNPIDRYLINTPMLNGMTKNPDGGLTIYVQKDDPGGARTAK
jgi:hypothetical protein